VEGHQAGGTRLHATDAADAGGVSAGPSHDIGGRGDELGGVQPVSDAANVAGSRGPPCGRAGEVADRDRAIWADGAHEDGI